MAFGRFGGYPRRYGGGDSTKQIELEAFLDAFAPAWDAAEDTENYAECEAYAVAVAMIWDINRRLTNQAIPAQMLEALPIWEETLKLRPADTDSAAARRGKVAAKLRGIAGNSTGDIVAALTALLGTTFVQLVIVPTANELTYWPGIYPGPPGYEWSSNRALVGVEVQQGVLSDAEFQDKQDAVVELLDLMLPSWMTFCTGVESGGFICDVGICGETFL